MSYMISNLEDGVLFTPESRRVLHNLLQSPILDQYLLTPEEAFQKDSSSTIKSMFLFQANNICWKAVKQSTNSLVKTVGKRTLLPVVTSSGVIMDVGCFLLPSYSFQFFYGKHVLLFLIIGKTLRKKFLSRYHRPLEWAVCLNPLWNHWEHF